MNLAGAQAWIAAHKGIVAGGAGVTGLALVMRSRSKNAASTATSTTPASIAQPATADTSAYDTYNALNDQLTGWESSVQAQIDGLSAGGNTAPTPADTQPAPSPAPVPSTTPAPTPAAPAPTTAPAAASDSSGNYVSSGNQFVNGLYVGPAGVPYYTQAQLDAMTAAQRTKATSGSYTLIPNDYAVPAYSAPAAAATPAPTTATSAGYPSITRTSIPTAPVAATSAPVASAPIRASATPTLASTGSVGALWAARLVK